MLTSRSFDISPVGRILNRLVSDISTADDNLQGSVRSYLDQTIAFLSAGAVVVFFVPVFVPFAVGLLAFYWVLARPYRNLTRDLRRLEKCVLHATQYNANVSHSKYRSPLFTIIGQVLSGLVTVRAFGKSAAYEDLMFDRVDAFQGYDHASSTSLPLASRAKILSSSTGAPYFTSGSDSTRLVA